MRLESIKLAGFKSFVDPTLLELPSALTAVVGPNGCGKSNVIDAVRWVMGESSAKYLRGESLLDVIFNGSTTRKPVGQASIELIFDNSDGKIGGEYAAYAEISVRRLVSRDGQSLYFLNGARCRRRDITDIFLGTGLGPRSYAIIEQGMISQVVTAQPEELRVFIEEAAGISFYKKRRHETELHLRHTQENLDRLNDLVQEHTKQLDRLKRQSEAANRFQQYQHTQTELQTQLTTLQWQRLDLELADHVHQIQRATELLEKKHLERDQITDLLDQERRLQQAHHGRVMDIQSQCHALDTECVRLTQTLQHQAEREQILTADLQQVDHLKHQLEAQLTLESTRLQTFQAEVIRLQPLKEEGRHRSQSARQVLLELEQSMGRVALDWETFQQKAAEPERQGEVEKSRIAQLERQIKEISTRLERLRQEHSTIHLQASMQQIAVLEERCLTQETEEHALAQALKTLAQNHEQQREGMQTQTASLNTLRGQVHTIQGRQSSLEALQQAALGKTESGVVQWLKQHGLDSTPRLGEKIRVTPGYERAVETVLGEALEALCVEALDSTALVLQGLSKGQIMALQVDETQHGVSETEGRPFDEHVQFEGERTLNAVLLSTQVEGTAQAALRSLLAGIYVVQEVSEAITLQKQLALQASVVTCDGIWVGPHWIKIHREEEGYNGVLQRNAELQRLSEEARVLHQAISECENAVLESQQTVRRLEAEREEVQVKQSLCAQILKEQFTQLSVERARIEHARQRVSHLEEEIAEQEHRRQTMEEDVMLARKSLQTALDAMEVFSVRRQGLQKEHQQLRTLVSQARLEAEQCTEKDHALDIQQKTLSTQVAHAQETLQRLERQKQDACERVNSLTLKRAGSSEPTADLEGRLTEVKREQEGVSLLLQEARHALVALEHTLKELEKQRTVFEQEIQKTTEHLDSVRMAWQALTVRCQTLEERLEQQNTTVAHVLPTLPSDAEEALWAQKLEEIGHRIQRLGAVNLAAASEHEEALQHKIYLESQQRDLVEALTTLRDAIHKMDQETRSRFQATFDKVNLGFQALFPQLFGGGEASLELTEADVLEAGITVMARPPGKRNSSIHLLSGGEKALTAVAFIFSIFQLNPAPFCMLDEVDAPLDDANVGRFCELVKKLSSSVQFIYVTHNKLAMEMAKHLVGVTMKEPGVSRLVAVDVEEAMILVGA